MAIRKKKSALGSKLHSRKVGARKVARKQTFSVLKAASRARKSK